MSTLALSLLGSFSATLDGRPLGEFRTRSAQALLVYVACQPEPHSRESLTALLWPETPQLSAHQNLRQTLYLLRQWLPDVPAPAGDRRPLILAGRKSIQLNLESPIVLDVAVFNALIDQPQPTPQQLAEAIALYRGDFLADFYLPESNPFEDWVTARRAYLQRRVLTALDKLTGHSLQDGDYATAAILARRQVALDNLRESAHRQLMLALAGSGQRAEALAQFEQCARLLRADLGIKPSAETRALAEHIAAGDDQPAAPAHIHTRVPFAPRPRHNLPLQLSSFIGREREIAEVRRLLAHSRLVTLTGAGGSGKTRLALQAAEGLLASFSDGVWFIELAALSEPALVVSVIAATLGIVEQKNRPVAEALREHLRPRQTLLVLDNCEHLIHAVAQLAETLLHHCPSLRILATSREMLAIAGEVVWLVPTLSLPQIDLPPRVEDLKQFDAVRLFLERATSALPSFDLSERNAAPVTQLCRQLDGMPLAIELAAARVKMLRVDQIVARLDDRFGLLAGGSRTALPRHQTLRALIDWSHDLLSPAEQCLLRRLSVFAGGFTLEAAAAINAEADDLDTLALLTQLVNKSLVVVDQSSDREARYFLLETIAQYTWEKLQMAGEGDQMLERHAHFFCRILEEALPQYDYNDHWYQRLNWIETEYDNWRAVLSRAFNDHSIALEWGGRVAARMGSYWLMHGRLSEGRRWLEVALAGVDAAMTSTRAALSLWMASLMMREGHPQGPRLAAEGLAAYQQLGDKSGTAWALVVLGLHKGNESGRTIAYLEQGLQLAGEAGAYSIMSGAHYALARAALRAGDFDSATDHGEKALQLAAKHDNQIRKVDLLRQLGVIASWQGNYDRAAALYDESMTLARTLQAKGWVVAQILNSQGENARRRREYDQALTYYRDALGIAHEISDVSLILGEHLNMGLVLVRQNDLDSAVTSLRESLGIIAGGHRIDGDFIWNLWGFAVAAMRRGRPERAACLFGVADGLRDRTGLYLSPVDAEDYRQDVAQARAALGDAAFAAAWDQGRRLSAEEAIALALE